MHGFLLEAQGRRFEVAIGISEPVKAMWSLPAIWRFPILSMVAHLSEPYCETRQVVFLHMPKVGGNRVSVVLEQRFGPASAKTKRWPEFVDNRDRFLGYQSLRVCLRRRG